MVQRKKMGKGGEAGDYLPQREVDRLNGNRFPAAVSPVSGIIVLQIVGRPQSLRHAYHAQALILIHLERARHCQVRSE